MSGNAAPYYKQNRLKQLRAFCTTARCGSISKAADKLFLSQPSVSLQIQALERELDTTLFERRGPSIRLTPEGRTLLEISLPLVQGIDSLTDTFTERSGNLEQGELNIAAGESTILYILPDAIKRYSARFPGIRIKLHNVTGRDGMEMLRSDDADFAIGSMLEIPDDIHYHPIFQFNPVLITPRDHPLSRLENVTLEDIGPHGLILPPRHLSTWRMVDVVFHQHNIPYTVTLEAGGWEVIKKYVEIGMGVSIVTDICLTGDEKLVSVPLDRYFPTRSYGAVIRKGKYLSIAARTFLEMMDPDFAETRGRRGRARISAAE